MRVTSFLVVALLAGSCARPASTHTPHAREPELAIPLAVTLDDLPFVGPTAPGRSRLDSIDGIVRAAGGAPLTGFVTCRNAQEDGADLGRWAASGIPLENHSHSHRALDELGLDAWRADVERCQAQIEQVAGRAPRFFRYPFLRTGRARALRDAGFQVLDELALRRAPVSIDTSDWALARPYAAALAQDDRERASAIAQA